MFSPSPAGPMAASRMTSRTAPGMAAVYGPCSSRPRSGWMLRLAGSSGWKLSWGSVSTVKSGSLVPAVMVISPAAG